MSPHLLDGFGPYSTEPNPCVRLWGPGPPGTTCKTCDRLLVRRMGRTYYKCSLRHDTRSAGTDHRVGWRSCRKYTHEGEALMDD
jgi:hypothetical protein